MTSGPALLSQAESAALFARVVGMTSGGATQVSVRSSVTSHLRWARNRVLSAGIVTTRRVMITRYANGVRATGILSAVDETSLATAVRALDLQTTQEGGWGADPEELVPRQQYVNPPVWYDATAAVSAETRSDAARQSVAPIVAKGLVTAGYLEVEAVSWGVFNTHDLAAYAAATGALFSQTVRTPAGTAEGWAGATHTDWAALDIATLSAKALEQCLASDRPRAVEPGRWTVILGASVVSDCMAFLIDRLDVTGIVTGFSPHQIGQTVVDPRITVRTDPMDPECCYLPFDGDGYPYRPVTWIEKGVLKAVAFGRAFAQSHPGWGAPISNPVAFRMEGSTTSLDDMIATTERGLLVSNVGGLSPLDISRLQYTSVTRRGLWLIENGKITGPVKNMRFVESVPALFNRVLEVGRAERTYGIRFTHNDFRDLDNTPSLALHQGRATLVAPPVKIRDFNFVSLADSV